jgi:drug/metabolite transporter (DMT)-like permease
VHVQRRGLLLFVAMCVIWGVPYLLIRVAVREMSPATLVLGRTVLAALLLVPVAAWRKELRPVLRHWPALLAFAGVEIALPWMLLGSAEKRISSSLTALLIAAVPLVAALIARTTGTRTRLGPRAAAGILLGMLGVAALVGLDVQHVSVLAVAEVGIVAVCYAVGPAILQRWLSELPPLGVIATALGVTAVVFVPIAAPSLPADLPSAKAIAAVATLAVVCTAVAFVLFFALIAELGPVRATVITYVNPAVAALLGVTLLGEAFTGGMALGFALVLAGSALATRESSRGPRAPALEPA